MVNFILSMVDLIHLWYISVRGLFGEFLCVALGIEAGISSNIARPWYGGRKPTALGLRQAGSEEAPDFRETPERRLALGPWRGFEAGGLVIHFEAVDALCFQGELRHGQFKSPQFTSCK